MREYFCGLDVATAETAVCVVDDKGEVVLAVQLPLDLEQIVEHSLANDALAVEHGARCEGWGAQPVS